MTLLNAPAFDERKEKRKRIILWSAVGIFFIGMIGWWLVAGRPVDWPWNWNLHMAGRSATNRFFDAVERNDLETAYGIWVHDKDWKQHPDQHHGYPFTRFQGDWSSDSMDNDYGAFHSHRIAGDRIRGNVLMLGIFVNGRKSKAVNLTYDPRDKTLSYSPEDVRFLEGPGGIQ